VNLQKILIAVDFSQPSTAGAKWVSEFLASDADLTLLHVVEPVQHPQFATALLPPAESLDSAARDDAMRRLHDVASYLTASEPACVVRTGTPHEVIVNLAREGGFGLVVIGPHGDRPRRSRFLGTTADRVVRTSPVPVLVATHPPARMPRHLLVPVDEASITPLLLQSVRELAERFDADITLLHVWSNAVYSHVASMSYATAHGNEQAARDEIAREIHQASVHWLNEVARTGIARERITATITYGHAGDVTVDTAASTHADMIIMGRRTARVVAPALLGSTIGTVLHEARCPVLIVTEEGGGSR
jgi:nucleotide-binding universal stress UspA family protein